MSSTEFKFSEARIYQFSQSYLHITGLGILFFLVNLVILYLAMVFRNYLLFIPSLTPIVLFIYYLLSLFRANFTVEMKVTFSTPEIKAKTFLPTQIEILSERSFLGILTVEPSMGLFPVATSLRQLVEVRANEPLITSFLFYAPRRGRENIASVKLNYGGFFGLFYLEREVVPTEYITITPEPQRIQIPWTLKQKILDDLISSISIPIKGRGTDFLALRDFQFGDEIRHIHWKATAKFNKIIVREYEEPKRLRFLLIIDACTYMAGPKLEFALSAAMELAQVINRSEHSVKILVYNIQESKYIALNSSPASLRTMGIKLHNVFPEGVELNYLNLLHTLKAKQLTDTVAIILSDIEQPIDHVKEGIMAIRPWVQRLFYFALYSPGFGALALQKVQDLNATSMDEIRYRREILEKEISRQYSDVVGEYRRVIGAANGKFHLVEGYSTNILLELQMALQLELSMVKRDRILGGLKHA